MNLVPKAAKKLGAPKEIRSLANAVGNFIRYWGFRRIHGQIWTALYLSKTPLSGSDLCRALSVSKALVSPALAELHRHKLIETVRRGGRAKYYRAVPEVIDVIRDVLLRRETRLLEQASHAYARLSQAPTVDSDNLDAERLRKIGAMITLANLGLNAILENLRDETLGS